MHIINIIQKRFDFQYCNFVSTFVLTNPTYMPNFRIFRRSAAEIRGGGGAESPGCEMGSKDPASLGLSSTSFV